MSRRPLAPCRVWRTDLEILVAGPQQPIPPLPRRLLRFEDPVFQPSGPPDEPLPDLTPEAPTAVDVDALGPPPTTHKRRSRVRTRVKPPVENRVKPPVENR